MSSRLLRSPAVGPLGPVRRIVVGSSVGAATAAAIEDLGLGLSSDEHGGDEVVVDRAFFAASKVVTSYEARAWSDLVLRSLARETNLLMASTRFLVVGTGPVAECLVDALIRLGARVEVAADDPVELLTIARKHTVTGHYIEAPQFVSPEIDVVITTGIHHPVLDAEAVAHGVRPLLIVNTGRRPHAAAETFQSVDIVDGTRNLNQLTGPRPIFLVPPVTDDELDRALAWLRAAYAVTYATTGSDADEELAKALLR